nr:phage portal protein [uncultured Cellulosilyticum sp.]
MEKIAKVKKFTLRGELTESLIVKFIEQHKLYCLPRLQKLEKYYENENVTIKNRTFKDTSKPNNKESHAYAAYITDTLSSYLVGKPIVYTSENKELLKVITDLYNYNDSEDNDMEIAKNCSKFGIAFEVLYIDENKEIRFKAFDTKECIPIFESGLNGYLKCLIRYYEEEDIETGNKVTYVEVYDKTGVSYYTYNVTLKLTNVVETYFDDVPVNIYVNNSSWMGDFEKVLDQIDAYDKQCSNSLNDEDYFCDAYMLFKNTDIDSSNMTVEEMRERRIIEVGDAEPGVDVDVSWLTKDQTNQDGENRKNRTVAEIHKLSCVPNLDPSAFVSHTTASHVYYSLLSTENLVSAKEKKFKKGLQARLEKIIYYLNWINGTSYDYREINISFTRNIPQALESIADPISKLRGLVSDEWLLSKIPGMTDIEAEMKRREKQNSMKSEYDELEDKELED